MVKNNTSKPVLSLKPVPRAPHRPVQTPPHLVVPEHPQLGATVDGKLRRYRPRSWNESLVRAVHLEDLTRAPQTRIPADLLKD